MYSFSGISNSSESLSTQGLCEFGMIFVERVTRAGYPLCNVIRRETGVVPAQVRRMTDNHLARLFLFTHLCRDMLRKLPSKLAADHLQHPSAAGAQAPATFDTPAPRAFVAQKSLTSVPSLGWIFKNVFCSCRASDSFSEIFFARADPRMGFQKYFSLVPSLGWVFKNGGQPGISMCIFNKYIFI